jgi:NAD(P)-dependent dehydrogenase (short-subunit alcohol dehydrogenase family)
MDLGLQGKVALVTGAGSQIGMGKAIVMTLAKEGCDIIVADIDFSGVKKTADEVKVLGRKAEAFKVDVTSSSEVNQMVESALAQFGKIEILVNNAGAGSHPKPFLEKTENEWDADININLKSVLICTKAVLPNMISNKQGKIINISSIGARIGGPLGATYNSAKAGVICFTKSIAAGVGPSGINVNVITPGLVLTNFGTSSLPPGTVEKVKATVPLRRITTTQDVANLVAFLASDVACDITGQTIGVDGGECMI